MFGRQCPELCLAQMVLVTIAAFDSSGDYQLANDRFTVGGERLRRAQVRHTLPR